MRENIHLVLLMWLLKGNMSNELIGPSSSILLTHDWWKLSKTSSISPSAPEASFSLEKLLIFNWRNVDLLHGRHVLSSSSIGSYNFHAPGCVRSEVLSSIC